MTRVSSREQDSKEGVIQQTFGFLDPPQLTAKPPIASRLSQRAAPLSGTATLPPSVPDVPVSNSRTEKTRAKKTRTDKTRIGKQSVMSRRVALPPASSEQVALKTDSKVETLKRLRAQLESAGSHRNDSSDTLSTGCQSIDQWLPRGGLRTDAITEWVASGDSCGAASLALITAKIRLLQNESGPLVVVSNTVNGNRANFYPPAAKALGISMRRLIWVRPKGQADLVWAVDQALRCPAVAAVWAEVGSGLDDRDARRFQLAAEMGQTPGLFVRPAAVRGRPSFAEVRFHVASGSREQMSAVSETFPAQSDRLMQVTLDRCRGGRLGQQTLVSMDDQARLRSIPMPALPTPDLTVTPDAPATPDETPVLPLAAELAHPKSSRRTTRRRA